MIYTKTTRPMCVLNLIITGIPSIQNGKEIEELRSEIQSFKPYYNWNTFNTVYL